jgi:hypothetical protein
MTAEDARALSAASAEAPPEKVSLLLRAWYDAIRRAAEEGRRKVAETALSLPRTPIPAGAKREALRRLVEDGFAVNSADVNGREVVEASW